MNRFGSATIAAALGVVGLVGCGTEAGVQVDAGHNGAQEALTHGDLHHRDYYYLVDVANNLLAQREHARIAVRNGKTADTRFYAQQVVDNRDCMLQQLEDLASFKRTYLPMELTVHQEYRTDRLARHSRYSDFNFLYLDYTADNLVKSINYSQWEVQDGYDTDVRRFADALVGRLSPDLRNADNLLAGRGLDNGGKAPAKGDADQDQSQGQDPSKDPKAPVPDKGDVGQQQDPDKGDVGQQQDPDKGDVGQNQDPEKGDVDQQQGQGQDQNQDQNQDPSGPGKGDNFCPDFTTYLSPTKG